MPARSDPSGWVRVGSLNSLLSSQRHHITLRTANTSPDLYQSILLFNFENSKNGKASRSWYAMVSSCPHLGAPLESAPLRKVEACPEEEEEIDFGDDDDDDIEDTVIVCPWHEYDFDLKTGESATSGLKACTFRVRVVSTTGDEDSSAADESRFVEIESPPREDNGAPTEWHVVEVRAVSEAFPNKVMDSRQTAAENLHRATQGLSLDDATTLESNGNDAAGPPTASSSVLPPSPRPKTLVAWACLVLNTPKPAEKIAYTRMAAEAFRSGECKVIGGGLKSPSSGEWTRKTEETPPVTPPREDHVKTVRPGHESGRRGKGGSLRSRISLLHSLANVELWAIDLGWDMIARAPELFARFRDEYGGSSSDEGKNLPRSIPLDFYSDFVKLSVDEAKHYSLLVDRLWALDGVRFGDLEVHDGLWSQALETKDSLFSRLSIVNLVHEARGLDVNPNTIIKMSKAGDEESTRTLRVIHEDELTHVAIGHRALCLLCGMTDPPLDPVVVFRQEVKKHFVGRLKGPFNVDDRSKAGLSKDWYEGLIGEKPSAFGKAGQDGKPVRMGVQREEIAGG